MVERNSGLRGANFTKAKDSACDSRDNIIAITFELAIQIFANSS
jgi:hypothetical protein